ncbi:MAG: 50S ribosomal protein L10 [Candidatus Carbobacillus altaicus]|uniref:Large ribosomal subunit protein uL10 n=1 Tax=Candidatus Carbonibacillus altaicus TaxID=2163959 RepID=A0A2R6Y2U6_9BACL|nr:50S ribosomal protein L10 [Candidatus Carbobacillus altaicus]PTQ57007.1 MAG: LSU ribosomal protein L10p (P0) [Candidatus Carbobacillus altaicus]
MNQANREKKIRSVEEIRERLKTSASTVVTDYRGLTVAEMNELRRQLREAGVDFKVYKNTLARRAVEAEDAVALSAYLVGPTALAFSRQDAVAASKVLRQFAEAHPNLEIKAGWLDGKLIDAEGVKKLADMPSREVLLGMLLGVMQAPLRNMVTALSEVGGARRLATVLQAVAEQKEKGQAS